MSTRKELIARISALEERSQQDAFGCQQFCFLVWAMHEAVLDLVDDRDQLADFWRGSLDESKLGLLAAVREEMKKQPEDEA